MSVKVVVLGAGGLVGSRFVAKLLSLKELVMPEGPMPLGQVLLVDMNDPTHALEGNTDSRAKVAIGKLNDGDFLEKCLQPDGCTKVVTMHLAALLSGYAEENFDLGMEVNLQGPILVMNKVRLVSEALGSPQQYIFVSTDYVACFNEFNKDHPVSEESFRLSPVSYGVQKACIELLVCDYSRKGLIDGRVARISAVIGRPGWSNSVSYPYTGIFTQPLEGKEYEVSLPMDISYPISSLDNNIDCFVHYMSVKGEDLGHNRVVQLPAKSVTLADVWAAAQEVAKDRSIGIGSIKQVDASSGSTTVKEINVCPVVDCGKAEKLGFPAVVELKLIIGDYCDRHLPKA